MSEGLSDFLVDDQDGGDFEVEEDARNTCHAVHDVLASGIVLRDTLGQVSFEVGSTVLMGFNLHICG